MISGYYLGLEDAYLIVASMGASAVLLFAVPHGALSQPWPLGGGHLTSALVGVSCFKLVPDLFLGAALAVGLAIGFMYYLRCIHPPGGATALSAVMGGPAVHELGYQFVLTPVLLNVMVILCIALLVNYLFPWRRYPAGLAKTAGTELPESRQTEIPEGGTPIAHADLEYALRTMDSFIDVTEEDLSQIYTLALHHAQQSHMPPSAIELGRFYSNGKYGPQWSVRQVVDESPHSDPERDRVIYKVVAGRDRRTSATCSRQEFARWAKYQVFLNENSWHRGTPAD